MGNQRANDIDPNILNSHTGTNLLSHPEISTSQIGHYLDIVLYYEIPNQLHILPGRCCLASRPRIEFIPVIVRSPQSFTINMLERIPSRPPFVDRGTQSGLHEANFRPYP